MDREDINRLLDEKLNSELADRLDLDSEEDEKDEDEHVFDRAGDQGADGVFMRTEEGFSVTLF